MSAKILVVDDEQNLRDLVKFRLEFKGYDVITAENGLEGLQRIVAERPELVILDVMMPEMTGLELLEKLRADEGLKGTKVLLLSAKGREQDQEDGLAAGADAYMTKPFRANLLLEKVAELLHD